MSYLPDFAFSWEYPSTGTAPPTLAVANTMPEYFGGHPTPPPTPPRIRATTIDDRGSSLHFVSSSVVEDELESTESLNSGTTRSSLSDPQTTSQLVHITHQDRHNVTSHATDSLIYDFVNYAYLSPIMAMIERAKMDLDDLQAGLINPWACVQPFKMFSLTAGHIPITGLMQHDESTFNFYDLLFSTPPFAEANLYCFPIPTVQDIQHELPIRWNGVYPEPIPPVVVRLHDLFGFSGLSRRADGFAFVGLAEYSEIWTMICQRGVDSKFRPLNPSATVETGITGNGAALYHPQHIVASQFAVNVFVEIPDYAGLMRPFCQYLGAFVLQVVDNSTCDCVPNYNQPWRYIPCVHFRYYKWDQCMVGLCNRKDESVCLNEYPHHSDSASSPTGNPM